MATVCQLLHGASIQQQSWVRRRAAAHVCSGPSALSRSLVQSLAGTSTRHAFWTLTPRLKPHGEGVPSRRTTWNAEKIRNLSGPPGPEKEPRRTPVKVPQAASKVLSAIKSTTQHENIYTIPNILTFSRLVAAPVVGWLVLHDYHAWAFGLFAYAGITDLVDGYIARRWNLQTVVGTVIDPMADKTLMTILTVCLAVKGTLPVWLAVIILGRDVALALTAIYIRYISLPPPKTFSRYWDFSLPSAEVHPTTISKYNTALQLALIGTTTAIPLISADLSVAMTGMQYLVATTTIWSGMSYIYSKDAVKILNQDDKKKQAPTATPDTKEQFSDKSK